MIHTKLILLIALLIGSPTTAIAEPASASDAPDDVQIAETVDDAQNTESAVTDDLVQPEAQLFDATSTMYGWTGNPMASGKYPYVGAVAVSDRSIPFGTEIYIDGQKFIVEDRTALWVHHQHGLTIDIYSEGTHASMLQHGRKHLQCKTVTMQTWQCITASKN